jgi:hypothetical protein
MQIHRLVRGAFVEGMNDGRSGFSSLFHFFAISLFVGVEIAKYDLEKMRS